MGRRKQGPCVLCVCVCVCVERGGGGGEQSRAASLPGKAVLLLIVPERIYVTHGRAIELAL